MPNTKYETLYRKIQSVSDKNPYDFDAVKDMSDLLYNWRRFLPEDNSPYEKVNDVLFRASRGMQHVSQQQNYKKAEMFRELIYQVLKFSADKNFDHYMQALEYDRPADERFYLPRRKVLFPQVQALQRLADGEIDELFLSLPPRVGKTTLTTFFYTWIIGRNSELSNLYCSFSDTLTMSFYNGVLEILKDPYTYHWSDIFPEAKIVQTNANDETLNIDRKKKYPSLTCRSLYGTLNGACDCTGFLVADDLLSGIEEAMNPDRLVSAWNHVDNNMLTRAKLSAKIIWVGTRWSIADPIGRRIQLLETDPKFASRRYEIINIPALNEKDESNFEYKYDKGFNTDYFLQRRASFEGNNDLASWYAQYQGEPIEREGTVFEVDGFMYYNGDLPADKEPDRIFMAIDPAFGGGDYTAGPIVYQYGQDFYVADVVYDNGDKKVTQPLIARKAAEYGVQTLRIETSLSTRPYIDGLQEQMDQMDYHLTITTKMAPNTVSKEQRIFDKAPDIRSHFIFKDSAHRTKEYNMFMQNVFSFKITGKNKHDDAPDSLSIAADMAFERQAIKAYAFRRPV